MKHIKLTILFTVLISMVGVKAFAIPSGVSGTCGTNLTWHYDLSTLTLTISGTGAMDNYDVHNGIYPPWYYDDIYKENELEQPFDNTWEEDTDNNNLTGLYETLLKTLIIEDGVTSIGDYAFYGCNNLTSITIPQNMNNIGWDAFLYTAWYNNQPEGLVYAGNVVCGYKGKMPNNENLIIKEGTIGIADYAFNCCFNLTSIAIPNSVANIGKGAFWGCNGLTSITIPNSVTSIGDYVFSACSGLTSVVVEAGNSVYDSRNDCNAIIITETNELIAACKNTVIPNSVTSIGDYAFNNCSSLTSITIPNSVTSIGDHAFFQCRSLTSIIIPNSVTSIGNYSFYCCSGLISITIPNSVKSIGGVAFYCCDNLTSVTMEMTTPIAIDYSTFSNRSNATLYVPKGSKAAYQAANYWKEFKEIVEMEDPNEVEVTDISQMENVIYIEPVEAWCGVQTTLSIKMKNSVAVQTIQFDLYLPDGVTIVRNEDDELITASKERIKKYQYFSSSIQSDGALRLLAQATTTNIAAGDGEICQVIINIPEDMKEGEYPLVLKEMCMIEKDNTNHSPSPNLVRAKLVVSSYIPGDANGDGEVNAIDFNIIGNYILGFSQSKFNEKAADINGDGEINAIDFNMVANIILYGIANASPKLIIEDCQDPS